MRRIHPSLIASPFLDSGLGGAAPVSALVLCRSSGLAALARDAGAQSIIDGAQSAGAIPFILDELRSVAARLPAAELYVGEEATVDVLLVSQNQGRYEQGAAARVGAHRRRS